MKKAITENVEDFWKCFNTEPHWWWRSSSLTFCQLVESRWNKNKNIHNSTCNKKNLPYLNWINLLFQLVSLLTSGELPALLLFLAAVKAAFDHLCVLLLRCPLDLLQSFKVVTVIVNFREHENTTETHLASSLVTMQRLFSLITLIWSIWSRGVKKDEHTCGHASNLIYHLWV